MTSRLGFCFLFFLLTALCYQEGLSVTYRERVIGCLFSDVCRDNQVCFDDNAFGRCEEFDPLLGSFSSTYTYQLDRKTLQLLEKELDRLSADGFTWADGYTQCILKTILNDRPRVVYDPSECDYLQQLLGGSRGSPSASQNEPPDGQSNTDLYLKTSKELVDNYLSPSDPSSSSSSLNSPGESRQNAAKSYEEVNLVPASGEASPLARQPNGAQSAPHHTSHSHSSQLENAIDDESSQNLPRASTSHSDQSDSTIKLSNELIKSSLRAKHLKRGDSLARNGPSTSMLAYKRQLGSKEVVTEKRSRLGARTQDDEETNRLINQLISKLNKLAQTNEQVSDEDYADSELDSALSGTVDNQDISEYINYLIDNNLPYFANFPQQEKFTTSDNYQRLKNKLLQPNSRPYKANLEQIDTDYDQPLYIPYRAKSYNSPEVRVIRDTEEEDEEDVDVLPNDSDTETLALMESPITLTIGVDDESSKGNDKYDDSGYLGKILNQVQAELNQEESEENSESEDNNVPVVLVENDNNPDDDDSTDEESVKEMLLGDINYNNNYDSIMPNFYRKHRYDTKKPGPRYFEEYFFTSESKTNPDDKHEAKATNFKTKSSNLSTVKKNTSIRSSKPVAEGPVKVDASFKDTLIIRSAEEGEDTNLEAIDSTHTYVITNKMLGEEESQKFVQTLEQVFKLPRGTFSNLRKEDYQITFKVNPNYLELNASQVAAKIEDWATLIAEVTGYQVKESGIGDKTKLPVVSASIMQRSNEKLINLTLLTCSAVLAATLAAFVLYLFRRNLQFREKLKGLMKMPEELRKFDYQELCRSRMKGSSEKKDEEAQQQRDTTDSANGSKPKNVDTTAASQQGSDAQTSPPSRSSTSSWVEEPVSSNMDITTGHIILTYMEDHLKKKDRLDREWEALCAYEADPCATSAGSQSKNAAKNRFPDILPYDHSRVILNDFANSTNSDYINANTITDHDPRNPAYIVTQGPLAHTKADFWQMIWEQGSVLIIMLTRLRENGQAMCERYWPEEGSHIYQNYEVHLVSEHIWCEDYLVRSFYLKNLKTGETRTVTQFHFLTWPENGIPPSTKSILEFRRKINKSYKGRSCPMVVHCSDGVARTGTYILIDMVLNRLAKGAKEIDIAATLEHIRDQRMAMVKTKAQFEFVLLAVADEVQAILRALQASN